MGAVGAGDCARRGRRRSDRDLSLGGGTLVVLLILAGIGCATFAAARVAVAARARGRAGPLSRQFAIAVATVIGPLLLALVVVSSTMFVSGDDAAIVAVVVVFAGVVRVVAGTTASQSSTMPQRSAPACSAVREAERDLDRSTSANGSKMSPMRRRDDWNGWWRSRTSRRRRAAASRGGRLSPISVLRSRRCAASAGSRGRDRRRGDVRRSTSSQCERTSWTSCAHRSSVRALTPRSGDIRWTLERVSLDRGRHRHHRGDDVDAELKGVVVRADLADSMDPPGQSRRRCSGSCPT